MTLDPTTLELATRLETHQRSFMPYFRLLRATLLVTLFATLTSGFAQMPGSGDFVFGDPRPDAPELAVPGTYDIGVRTIEAVNPDQLDVLALTEETPDPRYDRTLTIEVFYPASPTTGEEGTVYQDVLGYGPDNAERPNVPFEFRGRATRDAEPDASGAPYPLIVLSHGYPGSRLMMTYLAENLASKGYVVAAVGHTESTFENVQGFASTLLNRSLDQIFTIDEMERLNAGDGFLSGLVATDNTAVIGYSMGGYGALNTAGAGYTEGIVNSGFVPGGALSVRQAGNYEADPRVKAVVAFAPWGGPAALEFIGVPDASFWDPEGLAGLTVPTLFVVGSQDDVSGYEGGVKYLFENAVNAERYMLVYENARHNVAPNPPPAAARVNLDEYSRYAEFAWDETRINNINQHFVTAFLGEKLKGEDYGAYLDLVPLSNDGVYSVDENGERKDDYTYWEGFEPRTALGLEFYKGE